MVRHAAAVIVVMLLNPAWLYAQAVDFTVKVESATIHKSASTGSPVIGRVNRGTVLEVTRDLGTWVKVAWPGADDGAGYVHESKGTIARRASREQRIAAAFGPAAPAAASSTAAPEASAADLVTQSQLIATGTTYIPPPSHNVGLGGRIGRAPMDVGATARVWSRQRFGVQVEALRSAHTSAGAAGRVTSFEFAPSMIYMLRDHVTDNVWLRPYVGTGASIRRATFKLTPETTDPVTDSSVGFRTFGGAEVTFPSVPRFAVSADLGYLWLEDAFPAFPTDKLRFSISGHWYVK